jgi:hypothetical protein
MERLLLEHLKQLQIPLRSKKAKNEF